MPWAPGHDPVYSPAMSDTSDPAELARRFLDLWQQQVAATLADPTVTAAAAEAAEGMRRMSADFLAAFGGQPGQGTTHEPGQLFPFASFYPPGAAPARSASEQRADDPAGLARRLAELEARLDRLEREREGPGPKPRSRARKKP